MPRRKDWRLHEHRNDRREDIGVNVARLFAEAGHEVAIRNSHVSGSLASLVEEIGTNARAATVEDASACGEAMLATISFWRYESLPVELLSGKVRVGAMNYYAGRDSWISFGNPTSSELFARRLPDARLVKAFNTMYYATFQTEGNRSSGERLVLFVAGDDEEAKAVVSGLIEEIGSEPVDTGYFRDGGRKQHPVSPIYPTFLSPGPFLLTGGSRAAPTSPPFPLSGDGRYNAVVERSWGKRPSGAGGLD